MLTQTRNHQKNGDRAHSKKLDKNKKERPTLKAIGQPVTGIVKSYNPKNHFGFISRDDGKGPIFVHETAVLAIGRNELKAGEHVRFQPYERTDKGIHKGKLCACDLQMLN